jgi:hypothetical protein
MVAEPAGSVEPKAPARDDPKAAVSISARARPPRLGAVPQRIERDEALKSFLQNLLDSRVFAFMWGTCRY